MIYRLRVALAQAPYNDGEGVWRVIEIRDTQTLHQLHGAIFRAFDRWEYHLYSFFTSKNRRDKASEYASPDLFEEEDFGPEGPPRDAGRTNLNSLALTPCQEFYYMFDYGDDWEHVIEVLPGTLGPPTGRYPRVVAKHGVSPPQYPLHYGEDDDEEDLEAMDARDHEALVPWDEVKKRLRKRGLIP